LPFTIDVRKSHNFSKNAFYDERSKTVVRSCAVFEVIAVSIIELYAQDIIEKEIYSKSFTEVIEKIHLNFFIIIMIISRRIPKS
jgi:hypothetical protein